MNKGLNYPASYDVKEVNNGIKSSFGMAVLSTTNGQFGIKSSSASEMSRRSIPSHLKNKKFSNPGPG